MAKAKSEIDAVKAHFMETLGNIPEPIRAMADYAPEALLGYTRMRNWIYRDRDEGGALDLKTKELIYVLLDIVVGNESGAKNHLNAAMRAGLTTAELAEACMQVMAVCGIQTWGMTGWKVCDHAAAIERKSKRGGRRKR